MINRKNMIIDWIFIAIIAVLFILLFNVNSFPIWAGPVLFLLMAIVVISGIVYYVKRFKKFTTEVGKSKVVVKKFWVFWLPVIYVLLGVVFYFVLPEEYQRGLGSEVFGFIISIVVGWFIDYNKAKRKQ